MDNILKNVSCGVYIVTSDGSGCLINTLTQITSKHPLVSISVNKENNTNKMIKESNKFAVSILSINASMEMIGDFGFKSSLEYDKFKNVKYVMVENIPVITENVVGYIVCEVKNVIDCETHDLFIGEVIDQNVLNDDVVMTYEYYQKVKKGSTPPKAPSFVESNDEIIENDKKQYQCIICGHIYDDAEENIKFEDLPDNWVCPKCRVGKDKFKRIK